MICSFVFWLSLRFEPNVAPRALGQREMPEQPQRLRQARREPSDKPQHRIHASFIHAPFIAKARHASFIA
jgi:hypothetical protein